MTGTLVSSLWITEAREARAGDRGWVEVKTGDKRMKIMYYDEKVGSNSVASTISSHLSYEMNEEDFHHICVKKARRGPSVSV